MADSIDNPVWEGAPKVTFDKGYDIIATGRGGDVGENGWLIGPDNTHVGLIVTEVGIDLALSGIKAQSLYKADFYAHNFVQPSFIIACHAPNQRDHGRIAEFIYAGNQLAVSTRQPFRLLIPGSGMAHTARWGKMKGVHNGIDCAGFPKGFKRQHRAHEYAPEFSFNFVVQAMHSGLYADDPVLARKLRSWNDIIQAQIDQHDFVTPDEAEQAEHQNGFGPQEDKPTIIQEVEGLKEFLGSIF